MGSAQLPLTPLQELSESLSGKTRAIVISEMEIDLRPGHGSGMILVMKMVEGSLAAGGRGAGFGERRITSVAFYRLGGGGCEKLFETEEEPLLAAFEVPYYVSRLPFVLEDGTEVMGYGAVDPDLVAEYSRKIP